jgi:hypothetical protein
VIQARSACAACALKLERSNSMDDAVIRLEEHGEPLGEALVYRHSSPPPLSASPVGAAAAASLG